MLSFAVIAHAAWVSDAAQPKSDSSGRPNADPVETEMAPQPGIEQSATVEVDQAERADDPSGAQETGQGESSEQPAKDPEESARPTEVGIGELVAYSSPQGVNDMTGGVMTGMLNPILVTTLGLSPGPVGILLMVRGLWDAFTDPVMGYLTDNTRSRMGRRRPYVIVGGILMAITMAGAWWVIPHDAKNQTMSFLYGLIEINTALVAFGVAMILFATAQTIFSVPHGALGLELSLTYNGRTRVQMAKTISSRIASFAQPYFFPFCLLSIFVFGNEMSMGDEKTTSALNGIRVLAIILAVLLVISSIYAGLGTKERVKITAQKDNLFKAMLETFRSLHFLRIAFIYVALLFTLGAFGVFQYYLTIYYVFRGDEKVGATFGAGVETFANVLVLLAVPGVWYLCKRFGKHNALRLALVMMIIGSLLQLVLLNPEMPYLMFISPFFYSLGIVATFMVLGTMLADVVDADELKTHRRREGLFSATAAFMMKTVGAVAAGFSGYLIEFTGFDIDKGANQDEGVFSTMLLLFAGKAIILVICLVILHKYPLTEKRVAEIQAELRRRGEFPNKPKESD